jgi:hypothetical protein
MAKSTRSKVKRAFRSKKREVGVYAATEAARLNRLNAKLVSLASADHDKDVQVEDAEGGEGLPGWCWFAVLGLLDPGDITVESMDSLSGSTMNQSGGRMARHGLTGDA